jgi:hypothetical protein
MNKKELRKLKDWTRKVTRGQRDSAVFLDLWSDVMADDPSSEPVPVMQLGYAMLLDKPIVIVAPHGSRIPENVKRAARAVEFYDRTDTSSLHAATIRAMKAAGLEVQH